MSRLVAEICRGLDSVFNNKRTCHRRGPVPIRVKACDKRRWSLSLPFDIWVKWHTISLQYRPGLHNQLYWAVAYRPSKRLTIAHVVRYLPALCGRHLVTHLFLKALMLEGIQIYPFSRKQPQGMTIAVNVMLTIESNKATTLLTSLAPSPTHSYSFSLYCMANCIYELITLKLRRLRSIVAIKCSSLFSYNTLI